MSATTPSTAGDVAEFTVKAVIAGVLLGIVFGAANAYLGLRVGLTVSASIPAAVMTVALFRLFRTRGTILEANLSQTIGSASTSLASGTIFTIPALFMWGLAPPYLQVVALSFLGAVLGLAAMIPLRRLLIVESRDELPYPEGTACAAVLRATVGGSTASAWIFRGMALGAGIKLALSLAFLMPASVHTLLPVLPKAEVAMELAPALLGVGFILGYRQSGILVAGSIVSALVLTPLIAWAGASLTAPLAPETTKLVTAMSANEIWARYVRYIGAGAVAAAGIITVVRGLPTMIDAIVAVGRGMRHETGRAEPAAVPRTDRDLPGSFVIGAVIFVVVVAAIVPGVFAGNLLPAAARHLRRRRRHLRDPLRHRCRSHRRHRRRVIAAYVGDRAHHADRVASVFAAAGWTDTGARAAVPTVATIVAVAASKAGDISQDLKTGYLVGATPARQQFGQLIGASFACWAVAGTVILLWTGVHLRIA